MSKSFLNEFSKDQLCDLTSAMSKSWLALDGLWFQKIEEKMDLDTAMRWNLEVWTNYTRIEAKRIKEFLNLSQNPGLEGLALALQLRFYANLNQDQLIREGDRLIYRMNVCRVQAARERKGLPHHPCKPVAKIEYGGFAAEIDDRIQCKCLSCYPDVTDETCSCAWEFSIGE